MKRSGFTDNGIVGAVKRVEAGLAVPELCRELGGQHSHVLQMAREIRRHGRVSDGVDERA